MLIRLHQFEIVCLGDFTLIIMIKKTCFAVICAQDKHVSANVQSHNSYIHMVAVLIMCLQYYRSSSWSLHVYQTVSWYGTAMGICIVPVH